MGFLVNRYWQMLFGAGLVRTVEDFGAQGEWPTHPELLQALTLMNDVTYVEASRVLAQRVLAEGGATPEQRLTRMFRLLTARNPRPAELAILRANLDQQLARYRRDRQAAVQLIRTGEAAREEKLDAAELAAYTAVANLLLNLDETITKE